MKVSSEMESLYGSKIQIASINDGGNSSWGEKEEYEDNSIRLAWHKEDGGFDPISSAELPIWGLKALVIAAASKDMINKADLAELIGSLTSSIFRQV